MNKYAVVVFPDEAKAYEGVRALQQLHEEGSVTVYGTIVVQRQADGAMAVKQRTDEGPVGLGVGMLAGGLLGLLGGPAGAAIGVAAGGLAGTWGDYLHAEVSDEFLEDIQRVLTPGRFAVVAELSEEWLAPIDTRMKALGGTVVRERRQDFVDDLIEKRTNAMKAELAQRKSELKSDIARRKAEHAGESADWMETALDADIVQTQSKLQRAAEKARTRLQHTKEEIDAKLKALETQAAKANPEVKGRVQQRISELRADFGTREQKLTKAFELAQEALQS
jgi:uncharacterized membrane protein